MGILKSNLKSTISLVLIIGFLFIFPLSANILLVSRESHSKSEFTSHGLKTSANSGKIYINNNWTATKTAGICTGDGTVSDPYLIEDKVIDAGGIGNGISIENTTEYFRIQNCTLYNSGLNFNDAGINLNITQNGVFINNTMYNNSQGMSIYKSLNLKIIRNMFYGPYAIKLLYTNDSLLYLNSFMTDIKVFFYYAYNQYNSQEMFTYIYQGRTYTNYLGNYWEGVNVGLDQNDDGIADSVYHVTSHYHSARLNDYYPLMEPLPNYQLIVANEISGYNLLFLVCFLGVTSLILVKKFKKNIKSK